MKRKILIVTPYVDRTGGGVSEVARITGNELSRREDFDVEVCTLQSQYFNEDKNLWAVSKITAFRILGTPRYGFSIGMLRHLIKSDADVIHVHGVWMFHCLAVWLKHLFSGVEYVVTPHGMLDPWILKRSFLLKIAIRFFYQDRFLKSAKFVQALTTTECTDVRAISNEIKIKLIPNFVTMPVFDGELPAWYSEKIKEKNVYLFLGRIHDKKGWRELFSAWEIASSSNDFFLKNNFLIIAGWIDGDLDFNTAVKDLRCRFDNIDYVGPQYGLDKVRSYQYADFFILPSKSEGLPMVVLEAWTSRTIVLMTEACNLSIGFDCGAALRISLNPHELAKQLIDSYNLSEESRIRIRNNAEDLVRARFSTAEVMNSLIAGYAS